MTQTGTERMRHAIEVRLRSKVSLSVIIWPANQPNDPCVKLTGPSKVWMTASAGYPVLLRHQDEKLWTKYDIESITLFRVYPGEFNGAVVLSATNCLDDQ